VTTNWEIVGAFVGLLVLQTMWITHLFSQLRSDFRSHTHPDHGTNMRIEYLEKRLDNLEKRTS